MKKKAEILRLDIVLLGDFNPKIFSPAWFSNIDLIGEKESEEANVELIHQDVSIFSLDWCRFQVTRDRFSIFTEQEAYFTKLIDLVIQTFTYLSHTPIVALGANWGGHYKADSEEEWHRFGHFLAPQIPWLNIFENPAVFKIEIMEKHPEIYSSFGKKQVRVEPSGQVNHGVFINLNDHYELEPDAKRVGCSEMISLFENNREKSSQKYTNLVQTLFDNFEAAKK